jgi:hypothetical protein
MPAKNSTAVEAEIMEVKCLEIRDDGTFIPVICIRPVPANEAQRYLLRRDGYRGTRTKKQAHHWIAEHWREIKDGDVIDVEYILGERPTKKISERCDHGERPA